MKRLGGARGSYSAIKWSEYFDREDTVSVHQGNFQVYVKGSSGPVLLAIHGGGYSALTYALFAKEISKLVTCQILAIDLRGHGKTVTTDDADLSLETLRTDVIAILNTLNPKECPIILIGHSMGGALAVEVATKFEHVSAVMVLDVVEGTALSSLSSMQAYLRSRPNSFNSIEEAIRWCWQTGKTHNLEAARVSIPGQIINAASRELAALEIESRMSSESNEVFMQELIQELTPNAILEEVESFLPDPIEHDSESTSGKYAVKGNIYYTWKIDLSKTEQYWCGWFKGLSQKFLSVRAPKILLLADVHELDKDLTIGQMQGKFQLEVLAHSGHAIQEDRPRQIAEIISVFLKKQGLIIPQSGAKTTTLNNAICE